MISIAMFFAGLVAASASTWAEVGEKNIASLRKMNAVSQSFKGAQITAEFMEKASVEMMSYFAPKMSCRAAEVHLVGVSPTECFMAVGQRMSNNGNVKMMDWEQTNLAIDPASGGRTILTYQPGDVTGTSMNGEIVPGTEVSNMIVNYLYEFNNEGLVSGFAMDFDSSILQGISQKVRAYNAAQAQGMHTDLSKGVMNLGVTSHWMQGTIQDTRPSLSLTEKSSRPILPPWQEVGERHLATVRHLDDISKQLKGKHITPDVILELSEDIAAFYAPKMTCVTAKQSGMGVQMLDTTSGECFQAVAKAWSNTRVVDFVDMNLAIDPSSGGNTILTRMRSVLVGVTAMGQDVPGTRKWMILNFRYKFNPDGLIDYFEQEFDSAILNDVQAMVSQSQSGVQFTAVNPWRHPEPEQEYGDTHFMTWCASGAIVAFSVIAFAIMVIWATRKSKSQAALQEALLVP